MPWTAQESRNMSAEHNKVWLQNAMTGAIPKQHSSGHSQGAPSPAFRSPAWSFFSRQLSFECRFCSFYISICQPWRSQLKISGSFRIANPVQRFFWKLWRSVNLPHLEHPAWSSTSFSKPTWKNRWSNWVMEKILSRNPIPWNPGWFF